MITKIKTLSKTVIALVVFSFVLASCKKEDDSIAPLDVQNESAVVGTINTTVVNGNYGNPASGPAAFGTKYFNIATGAQDSVGVIAYHLLFTSTNNGTISPRSGYTLKYLNTTKALSAIAPADYTAATTVTSLTRNTSTTTTANGWWNYDLTTHVVSATPNVVLFVRVGTVTYAFKCTNAAGQGSATSNRGVYTFQYGVVN